jgi:hypothetical protein
MEAAVKIAKQRLSVLERIRCHAHIWGLINRIRERGCTMEVVEVGG